MTHVYQYIFITPQFVILLFSSRTIPKAIYTFSDNFCKACWEKNRLSLPQQEVVQLDTKTLNVGKYHKTQGHCKRITGSQPDHNNDWHKTHPNCLEVWKLFKLRTIHINFPMLFQTDMSYLTWAACENWLSSHCGKCHTWPTNKDHIG